VIDEGKLEELAEIIKALKYVPLEFNNPELFPEVDNYIYPNYVFFMVAIDHRTGFDLEWKYRGSDLLFYLARKKQKECIDFFTAKKLLSVTEKEIENIFTFRGITVRNPEERAFLLRDCAEKLVEFYDGDFMNLLSQSNFFVSKILERLRVFRAYEDPMMKKSFLLLKILKRSGFSFRDPENIKFPVDNVLVSFAISSRILKSDELLEKIRAGVMLSEEETFLLRRETAKALEILSQKTGIEPDILDDILWLCGRGTIEQISERVERDALKKLLEFISERVKIKFPPSWFF